MSVDSSYQVNRAEWGQRTKKLFSNNGQLKSKLLAANQTLDSRHILDRCSGVLSHLRVSHLSPSSDTQLWDCAVCSHSHSHRPNSLTRELRWGEFWANYHTAGLMSNAKCQMFWLNFRGIWFHKWLPSRESGQRRTWRWSCSNVNNVFFKLFSNILH